MPPTKAGGRRWGHPMRRLLARVGAMSALVAITSTVAVVAGPEPASAVNPTVVVSKTASLKPGTTVTVSSPAGSWLPNDHVDVWICNTKIAADHQQLAQ